MGAKKLVLKPNVAINGKISVEGKKKNIREVWKKLWSGLNALALAAISLAGAIFSHKIVREVAPGHYVELERNNYHFPNII